MRNKLGFTLLEILVVVLIIGILGAIALPQYQRAVLKSRFAALMPIAKSMADSNEAYYLEHGEYAGNAEDLPVQGRNSYPDGTELEFGTTSDYSYVLATNPGVENNMYVVYQKHSENFPGNIHCEALTEDAQANKVCLDLGGTPLEGSLSGDEYTAYLLSGDGTTGTFAKECTGEPDISRECSECGFMTREAVCDTRTGEWTYEGDFDPATCPAKPQAETDENCEAGTMGQRTREATCNSDHTAWEYTGSWNTDACKPVYTSFKTSREANLFAGAIFDVEGACDARIANGCSGATFQNGGQCIESVSNGCSGATFKAGGVCRVSKKGGCKNVTYKSGSYCVSGASKIYCPANTPAEGGKCWDGYGSKVSCILSPFS